MKEQVCSRCNGTKVITALIGKNREPGTITCPDCSHGKTLTKGDK